MDSRCWTARRMRSTASCMPCISPGSCSASMCGSRNSREAASVASPRCKRRAATHSGTFKTCARCAVATRSESGTIHRRLAALRKSGSVALLKNFSIHSGKSDLDSTPCVREGDGRKRTRLLAQVFEASPCQQGTTRHRRRCPKRCCPTQPWLPSTADTGRTSRSQSHTETSRPGAQTPTANSRSCPHA